VLHFGSSCPARKGSPLRRGHDPPALHGRVVDAAILFLALVTWACFQLGLNLATTDFGFLIAIVLLSHFDGFVSSVSSDHCRRLPRLLLHGGRQHRERYCAGRPPRQVARHYGLDAAPTIDVTAARRADEELHRAQAELAHVIRLPTLGELLAL